MTVILGMVSSIAQVNCWFLYTDCTKSCVIKSDLGGLNVVRLFLPHTFCVLFLFSLGYKRWHLPVFSSQELVNNIGNHCQQTLKDGTPRDIKFSPDSDLGDASIDMIFPLGKGVSSYFSFSPECKTTFSVLSEQLFSLVPPAVLVPGLSPGFS